MFQRFLIVFLALAVSGPFLRGTEMPPGWRELLDNRFADATAVFQQRVDQDGRDTMSMLGLMWIAEAHTRHAQAAMWLKRTLEASADPYTTLNASLGTVRLFSGVTRISSPLTATLRTLVDKPDATGVAAAAAIGRLADANVASARLGDARSLTARLGAILTWRLVGPFNNISGSGHERAFEPERADNPSASYEGDSDALIKWIEPSAYRPDAWVDFARYYPTVSATFYAVTYVNVPKSQRVQLRLGTSGAFKLLVNGSTVHESANEHNNDIDTYRVNVTLGSGWNRIMVKCSASEIERCNFLLRITDDSGRPIPLRASTEAHSVSAEKPDPEVLSNPFVEVLQERIKADPQGIHHRLLLAETHLRNDEADLAYEVLLEALRIAPRSVIVLTALAEAYTRAGRATEAESTAERIMTLAPKLPSVLVRLFYRAMTEERLDDADGIVEQLRMDIPGSVTLYDIEIAYSQKRKRLQDVHRLQVEAFEAFPDVYRYALANATLAMKTPRRYDAALDVALRHLDASYTESALTLVASLHYDKGDIAQWRSWYERVFEIDPASPGYRARMSDVYVQRKDFDNALAQVRKAIEIAPTVSSLWYRAGLYARTIGDAGAAEASFTRALELDRANFDAREALRELAGAPSPWTVMRPPNIDSAIAVSPGPADFPTDDVVVVLDDTRRIVYDGSRSEELSDLVMRVLTVRGIDQLKESTVPYKGDGGFAVEKAVVVKADGREIAADRNGYDLVFKSLEVGDHVWIRYRAREFRRGKLSKHFWVSTQFNTWYPVMSARYSLIAPKGHAFQWRAQNLDIKPAKSSTPLGEMFVWEVGPRAGIEPEEGMPSLMEVGEWVHITSVPSWETIVDWYYDVARTRTRTSYETRTLMDSLAPRNTGMSNQAIIEAVYRYVTAQIRYSYVPFRQSGYVPQKARDVITSRIGDCKDVASLCIALLAERGISAWHVLVQTNTSPLQPNLLPSVFPFDHAIAMVETERGRMFMDLTAEDMPLGSVPFADVDALALVIKPGESAPFRLSRDFFLPNVLRVVTNVTLNADLSANVEQSITNAGARSQSYRSWFKSKQDREVNKQLLEMLASEYPDVDLEEYKIEGVDNLAYSLTYTMRFTVPDFLIEAATSRIFRIPWNTDVGPDDALSYDTRRYAYDFFNRRDSVFETITITLPPGFEAVGIVPQFLARHDVASCTVTTTTSGNVLTISRRMVYNRSYVEPAEYTSYKSFYNSIVRHDRRHILLQPSAAGKGQRGRKR